MLPVQAQAESTRTSDRCFKIVVQNLQKRPGLASQLLDDYSPDFMLVQEINLHSIDKESFPVNFVSKQGYGTAIHSKDQQLTNIRRVQSPHAEFGGFIYKKTTVADHISGLQLVSFHGYNGQPFKSIEHLVDHIQAVVEVLHAGPTLFAGDFNSWTREHLAAVKQCMAKSGLEIAYSWPYPGRDQPLDHVFLRGIRLTQATYFPCASDHNGAVLRVVIDN